LLKKVSGCAKGIRIRLEKRIPWGVGLGGGSSDAATTLSALSRLWKLKLTTSDLVELGARLGSDVPLFIHGGAALIEGRGEKVTPLAASVSSWFVLLLPPMPRIPRKTQQLYSRLNASHFTEGQSIGEASRSGLKIGGSLHLCWLMFLTKWRLMLFLGWKVIGGVLRKQVARTFT